MPKPLVDRIPFKKIVTACSVGVAVGFGLCSLNLVLVAQNVEAHAFQIGLLVLNVLDAVIYTISLLGLILSPLAWAVLLLLKNFGIGINKSE